MSYTVVVLNRFLDLAERFLDSVRSTHKQMPDVLVIGDGHCANLGPDVRVVRSPHEEFCYARNLNFGISLIPADNDIICPNDDTVIVEPDFFRRLDWLAWDIPGLGILSPLIVGCVGTPQQRWHERNQWWKLGETTKFLSSFPICFVCPWLSRKMLNSVGLFDEEIRGYGGEDNDLCRRALAGHWHTAVTSQLKVQHGDGGKELAEGRGKTWSLSFARRHP